MLGTTQTTDTSDNDDFLTGFLAGVGLGYDVYGCVAYGIQYAGDDVELEDNTVGTYPAYYFGDSIQHLK